MTHDDTLKRAAALLRHMSDAGSTDEYRSCNDCATVLDTLREELARQEPPTTGYVQTVPDKCDRIVWRGSYFHLPIAPQAAQVPEGWRRVPAQWLEGIDRWLCHVKFENVDGEMRATEFIKQIRNMLSEAPQPKEKS
jgi:hypothetical protein